MCGISGSGKTFHALRLEAEGYIRVSVDKIIWQRYGNKLADLADDQKKKAFMEANQQAQCEAEALIAEGKKVVVDATHCKRSARDQMRKICERYNVSPLFLYLNAPKEVLASRLAERKGIGPDDLPVSPQQLEGYCKGFEVPTLDETDVITENDL